MIALPRPILCRPAGQADTSQAIRMVASIWQGEDYVPQVWDSWLADGDGLLAVAEWHGRLAGFGHLADLGWGEAWLEGLRVAPDLQGQGIGSSLHEYFVARWLERGFSVVRLLTHERREAVKAMCTRTGVEPVARVRFRRGFARQGRHGFVESAVNNKEALRQLAAEGTPHFCSGLMDLGWELAEMTRQRLQSTGGMRLWSWRNGRGWLITRSKEDGSDPALTLCAAAGEPFAELMVECSHLAHDLGAEEIHWLVPEWAKLIQALDMAGFGDDQEIEIFIVYERRR
jgi:GNAT superfamily N-acetyltransferase